MTTTALTLREIEGEPRVLDTDLAERLGMERPTNIRSHLIMTHRAELETYGPLCTRSVQTGGRPGTAYYLNEEQALILVMFSRTAVASDVRREVITVYQAWRRGQLGQFAVPRTLPCRPVVRMAACSPCLPGLLMRAPPLALILAVSLASHAHAQSLHTFCAAGAKPAQSDPHLSDAIRSEFGPVSFDSKADECIYPLKVLRYAAADVLLTQGNVPGEAYHGCAARLSAYVLRRSGGELRPVARFIDFAQTGTFGSAGDITPLTIGGDDGLVIESGGTFQGFTFSGLDLYVFRAGRVVKLIAEPPIPTGADNGGAMTDGGQSISVDATWSVAPFPGAALAVDYKIKAHGRTRVERAVWTLQGSRLVLTQGRVPPEVKAAGG